MKTIISLPVDLSSIIMDVKNYMQQQNIDHISLRPPYLGLGTAVDLMNDIPSLSNGLDDLSLSFKSLSLYTVWNMPIVQSLSFSYIIIPLEHFSAMNIATYTLKEDATERYMPDTNWPYYQVCDCVEEQCISFTDNNVYLVNSGTYHSLRYTDISTYYRPDFGVFLVAAVNEDLSSYFTE